MVVIGSFCLDPFASFNSFLSFSTKSAPDYFLEEHPIRATKFEPAVPCELLFNVGQTAGGVGDRDKAALDQGLLQRGAILALGKPDRYLDCWPAIYRELKLLLLAIECSVFRIQWPQVGCQLLAESAMVDLASLPAAAFVDRHWGRRRDHDGPANWVSGICR